MPSHIRIPCSYIRTHIFVRTCRCMCVLISYIVFTNSCKRMEGNRILASFRALTHPPSDQPIVFPPPPPSRSCADQKDRREDGRGRDGGWKERKKKKGERRRAGSGEDREHMRTHGGERKVLLPKSRALTNTTRLQLPRFHRTHNHTHTYRYS